MTQVDLMKHLQKLARDHKKRVFTLKEIAAFARETRASAAMTLLRAAKKGLVARAGNLWINLLDPPELLEVALALRSPSYLSFESALYRRNILSQSPRGELTMATPGRSQRFQTPLGAIRYIHLKPNLFFGYDADRIALPEKAWLDLLYIRGRQGREALGGETFYLERLNKRHLSDFLKRFPGWATKTVVFKRK
jgi:predicted transcriptional regulator of viral defense system